MDLEDLMNVKVTSVSKTEQSLAHTAAAVFVINQDDIRRSGATNIPDLLRMAPGVDVEQIDANAWAISIRGFNSRYSNKVLVLIDGRTVYTPSFSGVYWEQLDLPLEDIDRIEVIRGPGASVWGANAVNGVISIFTKSAKDTKGGLVVAGVGSETRTLDVLQYGGSIGPDETYRVYGKFFDVGNSAVADGSAADDHWLRMHGGFRSDWDVTDRDAVVVEGDLFDNQESQTRLPGFIPTPFEQPFNQGLDAAGGDVLGRWSHTLDDGSQTALQVYYDTYRRTDMGVPEVMRTFDLDFQHHFAAGARNDIVWGLGYRVDTSILSPGYFVALKPPSKTDSLFSAFFQDEIRLSDSLWLTVGSKVEHNDFTGFELEPSIRLAWSPGAGRNTIWAAASKADRQPARIDTGVDTVLYTLPISASAIEMFRLVGNPNIKDEELRDVELGYRSQFKKTLSLDVATFLSFYRNLEIMEPLPMVLIPGAPLIFEIPMQFANQAHAVDYGGEASLSWNLSSRWRISPGYSYLHARLQFNPGATGQLCDNIATDFPQNMLEIRSQINLSRRTRFDQTLYYTARLPNGTIPGHARMDVRLARQLGESTEASIVGQNLLRPRTMEYGNDYSVIGTELERSIYGQITWRF
jgi:iron complex outermembrane receptor protein